MRASASVRSLISNWKIGSTLPSFCFLSVQPWHNWFSSNQGILETQSPLCHLNSFYSKTSCLCFFCLEGFWKTYFYIFAYTCLHFWFTCRITVSRSCSESPQWLENRLLITPWFVKFWAWDGTVSIRPLTVSSFGILRWHHLEWLESCSYGLVWDVQGFL